VSGSGETHIDVAGERLLLMPERGVLWPAASTLFVADTHWGKAATFRAGGVPLPPGTTLHGLSRLDGLLGRVRPTRLIFLGDFLHAREGRTDPVLRQLAEWRARHPTVQMLLVRGNHDRRAGDPPAEVGIRCVDPPLLERPFALAHHPLAGPEPPFLAGHLHPGVRLSGPGRQRERLACFWVTAGGVVLPAFGEFTGIAEIRPERGDRVFVTAGGSVVEVKARSRGA
jgi:uncharacterized protein